MIDESLEICIHMVCHKYGIENYTINDDGSIDVNGDVVDLRNKGLTELPLQFRNVTGYFYCYNNKLTTLLGAPQTVGKNFLCHNNKLTTLQGAPQTVGKDFFYSINPDLSEKEINAYKKRIRK